MQHKVTEHFHKNYNPKHTLESSLNVYLIIYKTFYFCVILKNSGAFTVKKQSLKALS